MRVLRSSLPNPGYQNGLKLNIGSKGTGFLGELAMDTGLDEVEKRTSLALSNQMEMLIFYLNDQQLYGINVFKIIEIVECPKTITRLPLSHKSIVGTIDFRGKAITVID